MSHWTIIKYLWQKFWGEMKKKIFGPFGFQNPKSEFRVPYTPSLVFLLPVYFKMTPKKKIVSAIFHNNCCRAEHSHRCRLNRNLIDNTTTFVVHFHSAIKFPQKCNGRKFPNQRPLQTYPAIDHLSHYISSNFWWIPLLYMLKRCNSITPLELTQQFLLAQFCPIFRVHRRTFWTCLINIVT